LAVTVTNPVAGPYTANGVTTTFGFDFKIASAAELAVYLSGVEVVSGFTVSLAVDGEGGSVVFAVAPASGTLYIVSRPLFTQTTEFDGDGPFSPRSLNGELDRMAVRDLILQRRIESSVRVALPDSLPELPSAANRASKAIVFDATGLGYNLINPSSFSGATGPAGPTGPTGATGPQGPAGPAGTAAQNPNYSYVINTLAPGSSATLVPSGAYPNITLTFGIPRGDPGASGALSDGTYGDIVVSGTGSLLTVGSDKITYAKMQNISATKRAMGRNTAGAGDPEEVTIDQLIDWVAGTPTRGDIIFRGAAAYARLAASTSGLYLRTNGAGTDPTWVDPFASPALTGNPTAPTPAAGDNDTSIATTAFVEARARKPNIQSVSSAATVTPTFSDDQVEITAQATGLTLANPTGSPQAGFGISIRIKDNGTARTIAYGAQYRGIGVTLPTTTVANKTLYLGMIWNAADSKWDVVSVAQEA
jgi:hypothetical protein